MQNHAKLRLKRSIAGGYNHIQFEKIDPNHLGHLHLGAQHGTLTETEKTELITYYIPLVADQVARYANSQGKMYKAQDLLQTGLLVLCEAIEGFSRVARDANIGGYIVAKVGFRLVTSDMDDQLIRVPDEVPKEVRQKFANQGCFETEEAFDRAINLCEVNPYGNEVCEALLAGLAEEELTFVGALCAGHSYTLDLAYHFVKDTIWVNTMFRNIRRKVAANLEEVRACGLWEDAPCW